MSQQITPKQQAKIIYSEYYVICMEFTEEIQTSLQAKKCALNCVNRIIMSNPFSNPFSNIEVTSTMKFWMDVRTELLKIK